MEATSNLKQEGTNLPFNNWLFVVAILLVGGPGERERIKWKFYKLIIYRLGWALEGWSEGDLLTQPD